MNNDYYLTQRNILAQLAHIRTHIENERVSSVNIIAECFNNNLDNFLFDIFDTFITNTLEYPDFEDVKIVLTSEEFNKIVKKYKVESKKDCSICMEELEEDSSILPCKHCYHTKCIKQWLCKENVKCPVCRNDMRNFLK